MPHLRASCNAQKTEAVSVPQEKQINTHRLHNSTYTNTPGHTLPFLALNRIFLAALPIKLTLQQQPLLPSYCSPLTAPLIPAAARVRIKTWVQNKQRRNVTIRPLPGPAQAEQELPNLSFDSKCCMSTGQRTPSATAAQNTHPA